MKENPIKISEHNWWKATELIYEALEMIQNNVDDKYFDMKKERINELKKIHQQMRVDYNSVVFGPV